MNFDLQTPEVSRLHSSPWDQLCQFALKSVHSFSKYSVDKLVTEKRTGGRTDGRTDRSRTLGLRPLDCSTHKNSICLLTVLRSCVFYDAERVLSAIAKFLVHLLEEGEGRCRMGGEGRKEKGWNGMEGGAGNGNARKIAPKCEIVCHYGDTLCGYCPVPNILVSFFLQQHFHRI